MNAKLKKWVVAGCGITLLFASANHVSAFYNASTGRWLSRDPIGEVGFQTVLGNRNRHVRDGNLYCLVGNNPLTKFDLLGLSESDVTDIIGQFKKTMKKMCDKEQRCDCFGNGPLKDIRASIGYVFGNGTPWGCADQADSMEGDFISLLPTLDDGWKSTHRRYYSFPFWHQDVKVEPTDANSGYVTSIILDTFTGCYTLNKREAFYLPGFPNAFVFWFNTHDTTCFTCKDFKNWK